jgi:NAD(P)-dependent dehydrogenase (short-subunit alcohol dehydrogenase family)
VKAVFDRIEKEAGRLDILVNNAFQVPSRPDGSEDPELLFRDFWEQPGQVL